MPAHTRVHSTLQVVETRRDNSPYRDPDTREDLVTDLLIKRVT